MCDRTYLQNVGMWMRTILNAKIKVKKSEEKETVADGNEI